MSDEPDLAHTAFELIRAVVRSLPKHDQGTLMINMLAWFMLGVKEEARVEAWDELKVAAQECMRNQPTFQ